MGSGGSKSEPSNGGPSTPIPAALPPPPEVTSVPCLSGHPNKEHLVLAFFAGVLLTLLLVALIFLIMKSYRKYWRKPLPRLPPAPLVRLVPLLPGTVAGRFSPRALDHHSDPPVEYSSPEEALTYANMTFKISEEKSDHLTVSHSADSDPIVYAQVKETNS
uniref:Chromosome 1 open reading frame 162 n=1 Tax=Catagonus wagneri TaxID=51154 RepID=A0A8C3YBG9_9CETA